MADPSELERRIEKLEAALDDAEQRFRLAMLHAPGGMAIVDLDGRLLAVNRSLCVFLGRSQEQLLTLAVNDVTHPDDREADQEYLRRVLDGEESLPPLEKRYVRGDGTVVWGMLTASVVRERDGTPSRIIGQVLDITERRAASDRTRELAERLEHTLESITDAVYTLDRDWRFTYLNRRAEEVLQRSRGSLLGRGIWDEFAPAVGTELDEAYHRALAENATVHLDRFYYPPLETWFEVHCFPAEQGLTVYFRPINARIERERTQQRILEAERDAAERLRRLDELKNAFLSAVSHELRTPLAIVHGSASTLQRLRETLDPATRAQLEDAIVEQSDRLGQLLADLLDMDRLNRSPSGDHHERLDVVELVDACVERVEAAGRIRKDLPDRLPLDGDRVQVERIVANLLGNAAKYAPHGEIVVRAHPLAAGGVRLEVHDQGPGIPDEELHRVFEPFHRLDAGHPKPGTGIGLALVAEFARMHGGRAWAERGDGVGAHLVVELPDALPPAVTPSTTATGAGSSHP